MSLHHPSNKPRSLHRQVSASHSSQHNTSSSPTTLAPVPSSLEHYVDQWLSRNSHSNNSSRRHSVSSEKSSDHLGLNGNGIGNPLVQSPGSMTAPTSPTLPSPPSPYSTTIPPSALSLPTWNEQGRRFSYSAPHCPCCQRPDCNSWRKTNRTIQKLEMETQLAAEIGQSLLQKNESYMLEATELKKRLKQYQDRNEELTLSLDDSERLAQRLNREKDKWMWQYEKSEQILNESVADLETTNEKCAALAKDLDETKLEMEKLQLFKFKSHQSDTREDTLQSKLEDTKQELMISRKNELGLETKYKKLMARYEAISCSYQDLSKAAATTNTNAKLIKPLSSISTPTAADIQQASTDELVTFIKDLISTNNGLKSELLETTARLDDVRNDMNTLQDKQPLHPTSNDMTTGRSQDSSNSWKNLDHSKGINRRPRERKPSDEIKTTMASTTTKSRRHRSVSARIPRTKSTRESIKSSPSRPTAPTKQPTLPPPVPQATTSTPVVHHHYHYYLREQKENQGTGEVNTTANSNSNGLISKLCSDQNCTEPFSSSNPNSTLFPHLSTTGDTVFETNNKKERRATLPSPNKVDSIQHHHHHQTSDSNKGSAIPLSPASPSASTQKNQTVPDYPLTVDSAANSTSSTDSAVLEQQCTPYTTLYEQATAILQRLRSTDARLLNRRLRRAFDIAELSKMSNTILQNVVTDVETMDARFLWLAPDENDDDEDNEAEPTNNTDRSLPASFMVSEFFPLLRLVQDLLQELGQLSITINHLQVAYVKKVEENEARVEQEILEKQQGQQPSAILTSTSMTPSLLPSASTSTPISCISFSSTSTDSLLPPADQLPHGTTGITHWFSTLFTPRTDSSTTIPDSSRALAQRDGDLVHRPRMDRRRRHSKAKRRLTGPGTVNKDKRGFRHQSAFATNPTNWPSLAAVVDEWSHLASIKQVSSSSLDREWLWTEESLASTSRWLKS